MADGPNKINESSRRVTASGDTEVSTYLEIARHKRGETPIHVALEPVRDETIVILDFGSQYSRIIARRIRELNVYCELLPYDASREDIALFDLKGIILSGGPQSVYDPGAPQVPAWVFDVGVPVLGICYGMQLIAYQLGGVVAPAREREYGFAVIRKNGPATMLLEDLGDDIPVWMSHGDRINAVPPGFRAFAYSENSPICAFTNDEGIYGVQFHPEVAHTPQGQEILNNFVSKVCGCNSLWTPTNFVDEAVNRIQTQVGNGRVICALSGGVDSAVTASLVHRAIGDQLTCIFVDNGLLRSQEAERVQEAFATHLDLKLIFVDGKKRFLKKLESVVDPEEKRKRIGEEFIKIFEEHAIRLGEVDFLAQGTLYPDVIESQSPENTASDKIKTHHNVGGLPEHMELRLVEPLRYLFKDEVRLAGQEIGLPPEILNRQPFPGPGLAIRIIGEVTEEKIAILQAADSIVMEEISNEGLYDELWQAFVVLTDTKAVGVTGDRRTYGYVAAVRAITSEDAMTADWARLPYELLARISRRIVNEVRDIDRVVYDITSKPPGTIEWE